MRIACCWTLIGLLFAPVTRALAGGDCGQIERRLGVDATSIPFAKDELGGFRSLGDAALTALKTCPNSVAIWYLAARSAEVLDQPFGDAAFSEYGGAKKIAVDAAAHAPDSAPIATILARVDHTVASARRAYELDPHYRPARNALALALAKDGSFDEALQLSNLPDPRSADRIVRARILLAAGQPRAAAREASKALASRQSEQAELTPSFELFRDGNEVLGFALLADGQTKNALHALRVAAAAGSRAAQTEVGKPP